MTDNSVIFSHIVRQLVTKDSCVLLIKELETVRDSGYLKDAQIAINKFLSLSDKYQGMLNPGFTFESAVSDILSYVDSLANFLSGLEYVEITLAFQPNKVFMQTLYSWFADYFSFPFYLHFIVTEEIGGGIVVSYKGNYIDLSLKKAISDYFVSNKENVFAKL
ncbi:hypothetical protein GYA27_00345 [candidate division WWE3 bacterium]|uniref:F-type ATPase subunit delta n=1 Tax=candidate division WWE3 bacterium TaxID=2053526 RepID=A0A7X9HHJ5_UNCKA|nr:hypothetical protein [candidate division WWE3 bacterium]